MKLIPLTRGKFAIVDNEDFEWLSKFKWQYNSGGYASRTQLSTMMHNEILKQSGYLGQVDHRNLNKLDNRRENLRPATESQQQHNKLKYKNNTTGFKGVNLHRGRFVARIQVNKKCINLGSYDTAEEASEAYRKASVEYYGEFSNNSIKS